MPSLSRRNPGFGQGGPRYPGTFLLALREAFERLGWKGKLWLGHAVECIDPQGREQVLGLENLFRRVRPQDRARWPELLAEYLTSVPSEALAELPGDLGDVAGRLMVRLGPPLTAPTPEAEIWSHSIVEHHLMATLVIDHANSMSYVSAQKVAESGHAGTYWLDTALRNLQQSTPATCLVEVQDESGLLQSEVGDAYDSSRALILDHLLPGHDAHGFFVALPGRDHLLILPVSAKTIAFLPWLRTVAAKTFRSLPYAISPELFWVRQGDWHHFPIDVKGEQVLVNPPQAFLDVLDEIAPPEESDEPPADEDEPLSN
jgi:hypothetical protein